MGRCALGLQKVKDLILCNHLSKIIGVSITNLKKHNTYVDEGFFFDHVLELENCYVNFCLITERNKGRYQLLLELNKSLASSDYFIPSEAGIIEHDQQWFYEIVPIFDKSYTSLSIEDLKLFWHNLDQLNVEANSCSIDADIVSRNNQFFKEIVYYKELESFFPTQFNDHNNNLSNLYTNFVDVEKVFELNRIQDFKVTGLQSFLPCPAEYAKIVSTIWSSFNDSDSVLKEKLALLDSSIIRIIEHFKSDINSAYYTIDINKLIKHYNRIEKLWYEESQ